MQVKYSGYIDKEKLNAEKLNNLEKSCFKLIGEEINLGSPKQVGEILFDKLALPGGKKTSTGSWSTNAETLENLANEGYDFPKILPKLRKKYITMFGYINM